MPIEGLIQRIKKLGRYKYCEKCSSNPCNCGRHYWAISYRQFKKALTDLDNTIPEIRDKLRGIFCTWATRPCPPERRCNNCKHIFNVLKTLDNKRKVKA